MWDLLPAVEVEVDAMAEQLPGACTTEIACFSTDTSLQPDPEATARHDHVLFDNAPTGHTTRLLQLIVAMLARAPAHPRTRAPAHPPARRHCPRSRSSRPDAASPIDP